MAKTQEAKKKKAVNRPVETTAEKPVEAKKEPEYSRHVIVQKKIRCRVGIPDDVPQSERVMWARGLVNVVLDMVNDRAVNLEIIRDGYY